MALIGVKFVILLYYAGDNIPAGAPPADARVIGAEGFGTVESVGHLLFTQYLVPFELTGILLLVAIIGSVVMAKRTL